MKTNLRVLAWGTGLLSLMLCVGRDEQTASADVVPPVIVADDAKPAETKPTPTLPTPAISTAANASPATPDTNPIQNVAGPIPLQLSPALADVIKLVQGGVGEQVLMAHITNSTDIFYVGSTEILYLHDLGVPSDIITALIQHDSTPEALARKQAASAAQPLPPGVALNAPATGIFVKTMASIPREMTASSPVADAVSVSTNNSPVETNPAPAVVYTVPTVIQQPVNISTFYGELAPYGAWVDLPGYGRCWRPTVAVWNSAWRPYADCGRWLWSDCGWYWYSDYSWGWAAFHYGRWTCSSGLGWVWVPGTCWASSWVSWRYTSTHCAWAPLPPSAHYVPGHGFYHNTVAVQGDCDFNVPSHHYVAVPNGQLNARRPSNHFLTPTHTQSVIGESTVANHYKTVNNTVVFNQGVGVERIAAASHSPIRPVSLRSGEPTVTRPARRELLDNDGRTLAVLRPPTEAPTITPPAQPVSSLSHLQPRNGRMPNTAPATPHSAGSSIPSVAPMPTATAVSTAHGTAPNTSDASHSPKSIIIRGNGQATAQTANGVTDARPATDPRLHTAAPENGNNAVLHRPPSPGGRNVANPGPTPAVAPRVAVPVVRSESARVMVVQAPVQRAPVMSVPAPSASAPAPMARMAAGPTVSVPPPSRVETYRASGSAPAPASSGGSHSSRSSNDGTGQRGSR